MLKHAVQCVKSEVASANTNAIMTDELIDAHARTDLRCDNRVIVRLYNVRGASPVRFPPLSSASEEPAPTEATHVLQLCDEPRMPNLSPVGCQAQRSLLAGWYERVRSVVSGK